MNNNSVLKYIELIMVVVNYGLGSKVVKVAKQTGVSGGTIFLGKGTINNHLLEILDLSDVRKEIILMIAEKTLANQAIEELNRKFGFEKPKHGIAFSIPVINVIGSRNSSYNNLNESGGLENTMYKVIFTVVDKGNAEVVVDSANSVGARGATIINARGSGIHETNMLFSMPIEPEKEIVMIIAKNERVDAIVAVIRENLKIDDPGNGIMFTMDVNQTYGLR
ncbi:MAG: P-II family nitrogen regulator [Firmicutes bacterium]|nr:P-II family nitrogen regulator [Bacillota bacterium]